ncbi:hypothetical protein D920_02957 [Enterococcus faecalis 13-SD-W-01]|nr:hypothetical protein D920_02957 [Enterococcus faecalis 13-SD-W-01]
MVKYRNKKLKEAANKTTKNTADLKSAVFFVSFFICYIVSFVYGKIGKYSE